MHPETLNILLSVVGISLISLVGALLLFMKSKRIKAGLPILVAVAAGALLGDTFLHLLPDAVAQNGGFTPIVTWSVLGGLVGFFLIENLLHWHHHGEDVHEHGPDGVHSYGWMNLIGDALHNFIDGMLIAGAWMVSPETGIATTIAVLMHEIPQEFGDFGVLLHAGFSTKKAMLFNLASAMCAVLGAMLVLVVPEELALEHVLVPIAAGGFLYVACSDLVPALRRDAKGMRLMMSGFALAAGIALIWLVHEVAHDHSGHDHGHGHSHDAHGDEDDHDDGHTHGDDDDGHNRDDDDGHDHEHGDDDDGHDPEHGDDDGHEHKHDDDDPDDK